jgi:hypothetical protein
MRSEGGRAAVEAEFWELAWLLFRASSVQHDSEMDTTRVKILRQCLRSDLLAYSRFIEP